MSDTHSLSDSTALRDSSVLRRVRHLGSAHDGLREWRLQRLTALALIPLGLYFTASLLRLAASDRLTAAEWLSSPVPALANHREPSCQRGECGMESPSTTGSPLATSSTTP